MDADVGMEVTLAEGVDGSRHRYIGKKWPMVGYGLQFGSVSSSFLTSHPTFSYPPSTSSFLIRNVTSFPSSPRPAVPLSSLRISSHPSSDWLVVSPCNDASTVLTGMPASKFSHVTLSIGAVESCCSLLQPESLYAWRMRHFLIDRNLTPTSCKILIKWEWWGLLKNCYGVWNEIANSIATAVSQRISVSGEIFPGLCKSEYLIQIGMII